MFVSFGALAFLFVNLSVIGHYRQERRSMQDWIVRMIFPLLRAIFILYLITQLGASSLLLGTGWIVLGLLLYVNHRMRAASIRSSLPEVEEAM